MIGIRNLTRFSLGENFVKRITGIVLKKEKKEGDLSIVFVKPKMMRNLNRKFLGEDRVTDVLTFGQSPEFKFPDSKELGEIFICLKQVKKNAKRFSTDFQKELARVLIHGILHLAGYDHEKSKIKTEEMEKKENYYFGLIDSHLRKGVGETSGLPEKENIKNRGFLKSEPERASDLTL